MKTIHVVLEEDLLVQADRQARRERCHRSALIRAALRSYLRLQRTLELEEKGRQAYLRVPQDRGEIATWEAEAAWPEDLMRGVALSNHSRAE